MAKQLCRRFSLAEIHSATAGFSDEHVIGKGGFGKVYKALMDGSVTVAIKRLASTSNQGEKEFVIEIETLTKVRHRNLVSLIGYCDDQGEMILVYEYMTNGTLADHLYQCSRQGVNCSSLRWNDRLKICIGAGRGLDYLHTGSSIIHRDVKSTNILLDENFTAKVADFGLAKHFNADNLESHVSASLKGTLGFIDPSFLATGRLTMASDVYAFGVVLLEVLSGKSALDQVVDKGKKMGVSIWAQQKIRDGKANQIVASDLKGEVLEGCLKTFVGVVKRCLCYHPKKRLTMSQAVAQLEFALEQQEMKGMKAHGLQFGPFSAFWSRIIISSGSKNDKVDAKVLPKDTFEEEAFRCKETGDEFEKETNEEVDASECKQTDDGFKKETDEEDHASECKQTDDGFKKETDEEDDASECKQTDDGFKKETNEEDDASECKQMDDGFKKETNEEDDASECKQTDDGFEKELKNINTVPIAIRASEIMLVTDGFDGNYWIASGSNGGSIFYGVLKTGQDAAIKRLYKKLPDEEFLAQVSTLFSLKHKNVVQLYGYCADGGLQVLVYEFAPQNSLRNILHGQQGMSLSWSRRIKIAIGAAEGLCYIHDKALVHHNVKSSNVLLFDNGTAKITDLHLSAQCSCAEAYLDDCHPLASPCFGYHPPEFVRLYHIQEGDVFSFGVLLLELLTGRKVFDRRWTRAGESLVKWARPNLGKDKVEKIVDARLKGDYPPRAVAEVAEVAGYCLAEKYDHRPKMITVLKDLQFASLRTEVYLLRKATDLEI